MADNKIDSYSRLRKTRQILGWHKARCRHAGALVSSSLFPFVFAWVTGGFYHRPDPPNSGRVN